MPVIPKRLSDIDLTSPSEVDEQYRAHWHAAQVVLDGVILAGRTHPTPSEGRRFQRRISILDALRPYRPQTMTAADLSAAIDARTRP